MTAAGARAGEHLAGFGRVSEPLSPTPLEEWGPVPTEQASLANLAPGLLPFFNNGPVFGLPGTVTGNFWDQTQLTGDWDGIRTEMTRRGLFIDLYSTSAYQDVTSGGLKTGTAFFQNMQLSVNTERALSKPSLSVLLSRNTTVQLFRARRFPMTRCHSNIFLFRHSLLK
jgi:hypothetical protein